ncbi:hypothetical protein ABIC83_002755 [Roseateles asaccharophilus]
MNIFRTLRGAAAKFFHSRFVFLIPLAFCLLGLMATYKAALADLHG